MGSHEKQMHRNTQHFSFAVDEYGNAKSYLNSKDTMLASQQLAPNLLPGNNHEPNLFGRTSQGSLNLCAVVQSVPFLFLILVSSNLYKWGIAAHIHYIFSFLWHFFPQLEKQWKSSFLRNNTIIRDTLFCKIKRPQYLVTFIYDNNVAMIFGMAGTLSLNLLLYYILYSKKN